MSNLPTPVTFERTGRDLTACLVGDLDHATAPGLTADILSQIRADDDVVRLDLAAVTFCDSSGIGLFVRVHQHVDRRGATLILDSPSPILRATFAVCGLDDRLQLA